MLKSCIVPMNDASQVRSVAFGIAELGRCAQSQAHEGLYEVNVRENRHAAKIV